MANSKGFEKLLEPGTIGKQKTKNRIIKSSAQMGYPQINDTYARAEWKAYYERFARGGVGLIMVDQVAVDYPASIRLPEVYRLDDDKFIDGLKDLAEAIHRHDCPTFLGLHHNGPWQTENGMDDHFSYPGGAAIGASDFYLPGLPLEFHNTKPRALSIPEIEDIIEKFAKAAERAKQAGFDGVDINAACSHLFNNFLSPLWNNREDIYGGSVENRARLLTQVIQETKRLCGKDFPVSLLINGIELGRLIEIDDSKCLTPELAIATAKELEKAGADMIQIRSSWLGYHIAGFLPDYFFFPEPKVPVEEIPKEYYAREKGAGANILLAQGVKKELSIPVTVVGRINFELGEKVLEDGMADFIAMTRSLHADPELPKKLMEGRPEDIAPCTACGNCMAASGLCRINGLGTTTQLSIERAPHKKKVMVIGGGPAGLEAARVSAVRGHEVVLFEKGTWLGGLMPVASIVKGTHPEDLFKLINYWKLQMKNFGVKVNLKTEANASTVEKEKPDIVFVATGAVPQMPNIPGSNNSNVVKGGDLHKQIKLALRFFSSGTLEKLTKMFMPMGKKVVIIGGGIHGCELAEFLIKRGRKVTIVEKGPMLGYGMSIPGMVHTIDWLMKKNTPIFTNVKEYVEITPKGFTIIDAEGNKVTLKADTIVPADPLLPNTKLLESIKGKAPEVYAIGDCRNPSVIHDAVKDAVLQAKDK
ncbi:FAD-dependent oxidoreductase [Dehalobacter sp. DCM]|uniref:FAD-dependent oxidoreductase n=1 Tax=Dehalobacter sp. DCM TaxID=2907827 RepID=UPI003081A2F9|nr:FAD-dependent oxidoreductase [Dehalobacter sp. DCM]